MSQLIDNRFELHDLLSRGGMGEVCCATDTQTGGTVAVKALTSNLLKQDPNLLERSCKSSGHLRQQ